MSALGRAHRHAVVGRHPRGRPEELQGFRHDLCPSRSDGELRLSREGGPDCRHEIRRVSLRPGKEPEAGDREARTRSAAEPLQRRPLRSRRTLLGGDDGRRPAAHAFGRALSRLARRHVGARPDRPRHTEQPRVEPGRPHDVLRGQRARRDLEIRLRRAGRRDVERAGVLRLRRESGLPRRLLRRCRWLPLERRVRRRPRGALYARGKNRPRDRAAGAQSDLLLLRRRALRHALHHHRRAEFTKSRAGAAAARG